MKACIIIHEAFELTGAIAAWFSEKNLPFDYIRVYQGDALPAVSDFDRLVVMGGPQSPETTLAESAFCPRQITRFDRNAYGFQCHMEFDRACVAALLAQEGESVDTHGVAMREYDFRPMHTRLFQFLSAFFDQYMIEAYSAEYCQFFRIGL